METLHEWRDDRRMHVLYGAFPNQDTNPDAYSSRLHFWCRAIAHAVRHRVLLDTQRTITQTPPEQQSRLAFRYPDLQAAFRRNNVSPLGLTHVMQHLCRQGTVCDLATFLQQTTPLAARPNAPPVTSPSLPLRAASWTLWATTRPLVWTVDAARSYLLPSASNATSAFIASGTLERETTWVHLPTLAEEAEKLRSFFEARVTDGVSAVMALSTVLAEYEGDWTMLDLRLMLRHLYKEHKIGLYDEENKVVVKWRWRATVTPMEEMDLQIVQLKTTTAGLEQSLQSLDARLGALQQEIRAMVVGQQKQRALYLLKTKKWLDKVALERTDAIQKLHQILHQISHAKTNVDILAAYQLGAQTMKQVQSAPELQVEKIDAVMDDLRDAMDTQAEIDEAMTQHGLAIDEADIAAELDALLAETLPSKETPPHVEEERTVSNHPVATPMAMQSPTLIEETNTPNVVATTPMAIESPTLDEAGNASSVAAVAASLAALSMQVVPSHALPSGGDEKVQREKEMETDV